MRASTPELRTFKRQTVAKIIDEAIINVGDNDRRAKESVSKEYHDIEHNLEKNKPMYFVCFLKVDLNTN